MICMKRFRLLPLTALTIIYLFLIFHYSSRDGDQTKHDSMAVTMFVAVVFYRDRLAPEDFDTLHMKIREAAHAVLYAGLGAVMGLWVQTRKTRTLHIRLLFVLGAAAVAVGFIDEWHKQFIPGRHFDPGDVLINAAAALSGMAFCFTVAAAIRAAQRHTARKKVADQANAGRALS